MEEKNKILDKLDKICSVHIKASTDNCRYAVVAMMGVSWGLLISEKVSIPIWVPVSVLLLGVVYFAFATLSYYNIAKCARGLHLMSDNDKIDNQGAITLMNMQTDKVFNLQKYLNVVCMIMALILIVGASINLI